LRLQLLHSHSLSQGLPDPEDIYRTYLGAAKGNMLIAEAVCLKDGRTTAYYEIRIKDELGNTAAVVSTTGYKLTKL
jgi:acyl-coenzyme A thioesterase PaaI-like protein